jgi:hypothetical protein
MYLEVIPDDDAVIAETLRRKRNLKLKYMLPNKCNLLEFVK